MANQLTQGEIDWAQEKLPSESSEVDIHELMQELAASPDSELYNLALTLLREAGEAQY